MYSRFEFRVLIKQEVKSFLLFGFEASRKISLKEIRSYPGKGHFRVLSALMRVNQDTFISFKVKRKLMRTAAEYLMRENNKLSEGQK